MTIIFALVFVIWIAIFVLSALLCDDRVDTRASLDDMHDQLLELAERDISDQHWVARKQLELTATEEMRRIADAR